MAFGKFKGSLVCQLPDDYLRWLTSIELRQPLKTVVEAEYKRRFEGSFRQGCDDDRVAKAMNEIITQGYRVVARERHPDRGGDHQAMIAANLAVALLRNTIGKLLPAKVA